MFRSQHLRIFARGRAGVFIAVLCAIGAAGVEPDLETKVKAAFLLNFTKFVQWPPESLGESGAPFRICLAGRDPFGPVIDQLVAGENVEGHPITVLRVVEMPPAESCPVVYVDSGVKLPSKVLSYFGAGVLKVGEGDTFLSHGGTIAFVIQDRRVRFDIALGVAQAARLKLSSRLLAVARSVRE